MCAGLPRLDSGRLLLREDDLFAERRSLVSKKLDGTATRQELRRLEYVHWYLERIEESRLAPAFDRLEGIVSEYERMGAEIRSNLDRLDSRRRRPSDRP